MKGEYPELCEAATEAAFAALEGAARSAIWAVLALYPDYPLDPASPDEPPLVESAHRILIMADRLLLELARYRDLAEGNDDWPEDELPF